MLGEALVWFEMEFPNGNGKSENFLRREGMRVFAVVFLSMGLAASPLLAKNAGETSKPDTPATVTSTAAVPDKPAAAQPESSAIESELQCLRSLLDEPHADLAA